MRRVGCFCWREWFWGLITFIPREPTVARQIDVHQVVEMPLVLDLFAAGVSNEPLPAFLLKFFAQCPAHQVLQFCSNLLPGLKFLPAHQQMNMSWISCDAVQPPVAMLTGIPGNPKQRALMTLRKDHHWLVCAGVVFSGKRRIGRLYSFAS